MLGKRSNANECKLSNSSEAKERPFRSLQVLTFALMSTDHEDLLRILQTQGQQFMNSFSTKQPSPKKRKRTDDGGKGKKKKISKSSDSEEGEEEEWLGVNISDDLQDISDNDSEGSEGQFLLLTLIYIL